MAHKVTHRKITSWQFYFFQTITNTKNLKRYQRHKERKVNRSFIIIYY